MRVFFHLVLSVGAILAVSCAHDAPHRVNKTVMITKPTIIAFMPPSLPGSAGEGADEAVAHLRFAVEDTVRALRPMELDAIEVCADEITLMDGRVSQQIRLSSGGQGIGGILVEPKREPVVVTSHDGPSTLQQSLPAAAAKYWDVKEGQP